MPGETYMTHYETAEDLITEDLMAENTRMAWECDQQIRLSDDPNAPIDRGFIRDGVLVAIAEMRRKNTPFGKFAWGEFTDTRKIAHLHAASAALVVPGFIVVWFAGNKPYYLKPKPVEAYEQETREGREDRNDSNDQRAVCKVPHSEWRPMKVLIPQLQTSKEWLEGYNDER